MHTPEVCLKTAENVTARNQGESTGRRIFVGATLVLLVGSVGLNVLLARRIRNRTYARQTALADRVLKVGTSVPPISAKRLKGQRELIAYPGAERSTILYIFTPTCIWCARNIDNLKALFDQERGQYVFIGLSLSEEGLSEYVVKNDLQFPVYTGLSTETLKTYKLGSTPQTMIISTEGKVLQDWVGAYAGNQKSQVEAFFHVTLPGLRELPKTGEAKN